MDPFRGYRAGRSVNGGTPPDSVATGYAERELTLESLFVIPTSFAVVTRWNPSRRWISPARSITTSGFSS